MAWRWIPLDCFVGATYKLSAAAQMEPSRGCAGRAIEAGRKNCPSDLNDGMADKAASVRVTRYAPHRGGWRVLEKVVIRFHQARP